MTCRTRSETPKDCEEHIGKLPRLATILDTLVSGDEVKSEDKTALEELCVDIEKQQTELVAWARKLGVASSERPKESKA